MNIATYIRIQLDSTFNQKFQRNVSKVVSNLPRQESGGTNRLARTNGRRASSNLNKSLVTVRQKPSIRFPRNFSSRISLRFHPSPRVISIFDRAMDARVVYHFGRSEPVNSRYLLTIGESIGARLKRVSKGKKKAFLIKKIGGNLNLAGITCIIPHKLRGGTESRGSSACLRQC